MKKAVILTCAAVLGIVSSGWAADKDWTNAGGNQLWRNTANWSGGTPTSSDKAAIRGNFSASTGPIIDSSTTAVAIQVVIGDWSSTIDTLTITGGSLTTSGTSPWIILGYGTNNNGTINISGGTVNVGSTLYVGFYGSGAGTGNLNMTGGTINVASTFGIGQGGNGSHGTVLLHGGTITCGSLNMGSSSAAMDITTGTLIINSTSTNVSTYVSSGWITGYGSSSNVHWDTTTNPGKTTVWATGGLKAANPSPADDATNVPRNPTLSWTAGTGATSHEVYFGTSNPPSSIGSQAGTTFNPGSLAFNTVYYWRIDEVSGSGTTTGDVWSFTAVSGEAKNPDPANGATNTALDKILHWTAGPGAVSHDVYFGTVSGEVSGAERLLGDLNGNGLVDWSDLSLLCSYWLADPTGTEPYAAVNIDDIVDFGDYAMFSQDWAGSAGAAFKGNQDANSYDPGALALSTTYYWRVDEVNGPDTITGAVWSFTTQSGKAFNHIRANSASGVATNATLSWSAGAGATSHDVYFGTTNPPTSIGNQTDTTYNPGALANSTTYYWRIDEVGDSGTTQGDVWSFTTTGAVTANIRKGPYLIYPNNNTQMTVLWQIDVTAGCSIAWGTDITYTGGSAATTEYGTDHQHKYNITGLTPGTKYYYRVTVGSNNYTGSFYAAPAANATSVKFFMYGDTRTNPGSNDSLCSRMISTYTSDPAYQSMVLHAGDWVDDNSEANWTSKWFTNSGTTANLALASASMPFMGTIGNHEGSATLFMKYWPYPFVAGRYFSFDYGPVHVAVVDQYTSYTSGSAQYNWLVSDLSSSTKPWKIIVLHQPGWCAGGSHGNDSTVQSTIQPLCVTYGVQIVLAGHNHYYSRAVVSGVQHVTSGAGGAPFYSASAGQPYVVTYNTNTLEFVKIDVSGSTLTGTAISNTGAVLDTFSAGTSQATNPTPENTATGVSVTPTLSWSAGTGATSHNVYFGTTNPPASQGGQSGTSFDPGTLANSTTYYWRVDEVSASGTAQGETWSFTTVPLNTTPVYTYLTWRNDPTNSVMVNWWNPDAQGDSTVDYGTTAAYGSSVNAATVTNFHHVELAGLTPGQTYHYRARSSDGTMGPDATYTVPAASTTSFSFAVYGDPRGSDTANEPFYSRHQALCDWILAQNFDFALETGDTVWEGGGTRAQGFYEDFFRLESNLSKSKVIMATMGNHEVQPNGLPYYYYYDLYTGAFPANGPAIDGKGRVYSFNYGNAHFVSLSSYQMDLNGEGTWLSTDLAAATANPNIKWIFVFMHYPLYTTNTSRPNNQNEINAWGPIFDQYHVDIVFGGHNHLLERSKSIKGGVAVADGVGTVYVTDGLGGAGFDSAGSGSPGLFVTTYNSSTLATCVTINGDQCTVQSIANENGAIKDVFNLTK